MRERIEDYIARFFEWLLRPRFCRPPTSNLPEPVHSRHLKARATFCELPGMRVYYYECGHLGSVNWVIHLWGTSHFTRLSSDDYSPHPVTGLLFTSGQCGPCYFKKELLRTTTRCGRCGRGIEYGEPCTLYPQSVVSPELFSAAISFWNGCVVGCLDTECCIDPPSYYCGYWAGAYFVPDEASPLVKPSLRPPSSSPS